MGLLITLMATVGPNLELHGSDLRRWLIAAMWVVTLLVLTWALIGWDRRRHRSSGGLRMHGGDLYVNGEHVARVDHIEITKTGGGGRGTDGLADPRLNHRRKGRT